MPKFHFIPSNLIEYEFYDFLAPNVGLVYRCRWEPIGLYEAYIGNKHYKPNSVHANKDQISDYKIYQNYPNPFNSSSVISYQFSAMLSLQYMMYLVKK